MFKYTGLGVTKDSLFLSKRQDWEDPPASPSAGATKTTGLEAACTSLRSLVK